MEVQADGQVTVETALRSVLRQDILWVDGALAAALIRQASAALRRPGGRRPAPREGSEPLYWLELREEGASRGVSLLPEHQLERDAVLCEIVGALRSVLEKGTGGRHRL